MWDRHMASYVLIPSGTPPRRSALRENRRLARAERHFTRTEMNSRNFFAELKRRNVYKVAVAYVIVGWLLLQAASIFFPTFEAPAWVMRVFITTVIFGFPVALILPGPLK